MLSEVASKQASSEIMLFERYLHSDKTCSEELIIILLFSLAVWPSVLKIHSHFVFLD